MYEPQLGQSVDCAAELTSCRCPQLKHCAWRIFSPETSFESLSKKDGPLTLSASLLRSFSML
jgi:hypothetical protein